MTPVQQAVELAIAHQVEPDMLNLAEAAAELRISKWLAYDLYRRGEFPVPVIKLGRVLRVSRPVLAEFKRTGVPVKAAS